MQLQLLLGAWFGRIGGFYLTWLFVRTFSILGVYLGSLSLFSVRFFGLSPGLPVLDKSRGSKSAGSSEGLGSL